MTGFQVNLNFISHKQGEPSSQRSGTDVDGDTVTQLISIEISLDGTTIFDSQDFDSLVMCDKRRRSDKYPFKPREVVLNVTIAQAPELLHCVEPERYQRHVVGDLGRSFPDQESEENDSPGMETPTSIGCDDSEFEYHTWYSNSAWSPHPYGAEQDASPALSKADNKKDKEVCRTESYSFSAAGLIAKCRDGEKKRDMEVQTTPRYLLRVGAPLQTDHNVPLAWPPMTNYKCGIIYAELKESIGKNLAKKFVVHVVLVDEGDNVGIVFRQSYIYDDYEQLDEFLEWYLCEAAKEWLMRRPLLIIADSSPSTTPTTSSLEQYIKENLSSFQDQFHICREPMLAKIFKSLLFCD